MPDTVVLVPRVVMLLRSETSKNTGLGGHVQRAVTTAMKEFCKTLVRRIPAAFPHAAGSGLQCGELRLLSDIDLA